MALLGLIHGNLIKELSEENIENVTKSDSNFAPVFFIHHVLSDIMFLYLKSHKNINFLHTKSMVKRFKYRFCIR